MLPTETVGCMLAGDWQVGMEIRLTTFWDVLIGWPGYSFARSTILKYAARFATTTHPLLGAFNAGISSRFRSGIIGRVSCRHLRTAQCTKST